MNDTCATHRSRVPRRSFGRVKRRSDDIGRRERTRPGLYFMFCVWQSSVRGCRVSFVFVYFIKIVECSPVPASFFPYIRTALHVHMWKTLSTQRAWMWFLLQMNFQVILQAWSHQKSFPTLITFMQFLSSVDIHVILKGWWLCETLPALITCEQFLSSVDDHVTLKVWWFCETLPALITCERFLSSVDPHVTLKGWWFCETLPALNLETLFVCQTLSTLITCVRFLSSVDPHVKLETLFVCQTQVSAGEWFLVSSFL